MQRRLPATLGVVLAALLFSGHELKAEQTTEEVPFTPGSDYKPADVAPNAYTIPGSALDLNSVMEFVPAGKYGRIRIVPDGTMEFEKRPGVPLRFKSAYQFPGDWRDVKRVLKEPKESVHREIEEGIAELRRRGYNMVRVWPETTLALFAEADNQPRMDGLDILEYFFAKVKENGIYVNLNIAAYRMLYKWRKEGNPPGMKTKMFLGDEDTRKMWVELARLLLCHVNPYTGMAIKDDPMLVCVEPWNEIGFGLTLMRRFQDPEITKMARDRFEAFLIRKYGKIEEPIPQYPDETRGRYQADWREFHYECAKETVQWFRAQIEALGCKAPFAQYNWAWQRYYGDIRYEYTDVVIRNAYFMHPSEYMKIGSTCRQTSSIQGGGDVFRRSISSRFADRPLIETEYNHAFWNQYEYEQPLFPVYSAFQGYTGLTMHYVNMCREWEPARDFSSFMMDRASEYLTTFFFVRGDITPSENLALLSIPKSSLFAPGADQWVSMEQLKCAFLTRFALKYEDTPRPELIRETPEPKAEITLPLDGFTETKASKMFVEATDAGQTGFSLANYVAELKRKGILPAANRTDPEKGVYESDTGEIFMDTENKILTVRTLRSEMLTSETPTGESLPCMTRVESSVPSTVALVSIDGKPLAENPERMLLFYVTAVANTGM